MAELHVEPKKQTAGSTPWLWIVLGIIIAAIVIYLLVNNKNNTDNTTAPPANTTGAVKQQAPQPVVATEVSYRTVTL